MAKGGNDTISVLKTLTEDHNPVRVVDEAVAAPLLADGLVRRATIEPAPKSGKVAINITAAGRGMLEKGVDEAPAAT